MRIADLAISDVGVGPLSLGLRDALRDQIAKSQALLAQGEPGAPRPAHSAEQITDDFMARLPEIQALLREDVEAAYQGDPAAVSRAEPGLSYPGVQAVALYRLAHELHVQGVPYIPRMMTEYGHERFHVDIHPGTTVGRGFFIDHASGVVIGGTAVIGDRVRIYQGVTLGAKNFQTDSDGNMVRGTKRHPTLGDDVVVYAHATVLGGDTVIGDRTHIGAKTLVMNSVPPDSVVFNQATEPTVRPRRSKTERSAPESAAVSQ